MTPNNLVHENERLDELHRNGYYIIQDPARFCFGMDAVLLSGFARARRGERVLDLGTGTGIIPILMEAKTEAEDFTALGEGGLCLNCPVCTFPNCSFGK